MERDLLVGLSASSALAALARILRALVERTVVAVAGGVLVVLLLILSAALAAASSVSRESSSKDCHTSPRVRDAEQEVFLARLGVGKPGRADAVRGEPVPDDPLDGVIVLDSLELVHVELRPFGRIAPGRVVAVQFLRGAGGIPKRLRICAARAYIALSPMRSPKRMKSSIILLPASSP